MCDKKIHTFGDSHSRYGWDKINGVKIHHLGPILCHTFGKNGLGKLNIKNYGVKENDYVCFCFGEIDCRAHINKFITSDKTYKMIIEELVTLYFKSIKDNIFQYDKIKVMILNVNPPIKDNHPMVIKNKMDKNRVVPFVGDETQRKKYIKYFNKLLKIKCLENRYIFIDLYKEYSDDEGFLLKKYSNGVHIDDPIHIKKFLNTL